MTTKKTNAQPFGASGIERARLTPAYYRLFTLGNRHEKRRSKGIMRIPLSCLNPVFIRVGAFFWLSTRAIS